MWILLLQSFFIAMLSYSPPLTLLIFLCFFLLYQPSIFNHPLISNTLSFPLHLLFYFFFSRSSFFYQRAKLNTEIENLRERLTAKGLLPFFPQNSIISKNAWILLGRKLKDCSCNHLLPVSFMSDGTKKDIYTYSFSCGSYMRRSIPLLCQYS